MSDYTIQELQEMLDNKLTEEAEALQNNPLSTFVDEVNASADLESKSYESEGNDQFLKSLNYYLNNFTKDNENALDFLNSKSLRLSELLDNSQKTKQAWKNEN